MEKALGTHLAALQQQMGSVGVEPTKRPLSTWFVPRIVVRIHLPYAIARRIRVSQSVIITHIAIAISHYSSKSSPPFPKD